MPDGKACMLLLTLIVNTLSFKTVYLTNTWTLVLEGFPDICCQDKTMVHGSAEGGSDTNWKT